MIDIASETWSTVRKACEEHITRQTAILMRVGLAAHDYDAARGEIAAYFAILALAEPKHVEPVDYSKSKDRSGI